VTVVVAYTPDVPGRAAVRHGIQAAVGSGERLILINATKGDAPVDPRFAHEDEVRELTAELAALPVEAELRHLVVTDVAEEILGVVRKEAASLVVVGVRRRSRVGKLILGSVAQMLILGAECPVLAVKGPPEA
jgi:nucleotide-binding universal stress UspA family protein